MFAVFAIIDLVGTSLYIYEFNTFSSRVWSEAALETIRRPVSPINRLYSIKRYKMFAVFAIIDLPRWDESIPLSGKYF